ncbi:MAG TPA: polynucleotide adenylyltransferase PcnB [Candidatus Methanoperedens sp.]|nr:polynucleotide adenylyltransferase PcnB [Candidatus Methanoperedens sp.]
MRRIISKVVQKLFGRRPKATKPEAPAKPHQPARRGEKPSGPVIVRREEHSLSRTRIDEDALKILNRLVRYNHTAYLVGGGVRDLLLDRPVKDFDIATSAHPQEIKNLFRNCRLIGRRFRLAHILFKGRKVIEVSTFRKQAGFSDEGDILIKSDNTFGTPQEDALRRDFTVNGLFYSITDRSVIDYVGGLDDLGHRVIRTIGDPDIRLREDPIRTLRAVRLAARLGFAIDPATRRAMTAHRDEIWKCAAPRIVEEFVRMLNQGAAAPSFPLLDELGILAGLLPGFAQAWAAPGIRAQVVQDLASLDAHQKPQGGLAPGLALAVLYYPPFAAAAAAAGPGADHAKIAGELLDPDLQRLKFPRAQLEKAVLLLAVQQRLAQPARRRGRAGSVALKSWFAEALTLFELTQAETPEGRAALRRLRGMLQRAPQESRRTAPQEQPGGGQAAGGRETQAPGAAEGERAPARSRRSRRGRGGRGRGRGGEREATAAEAAGVSEDSAAEPAARRRVANEDAPINPDAAFGDADTDFEPPGGGPSADERTD